MRPCKGTLNQPGKFLNISVITTPGCSEFAVTPDNKKYIY